MKTKIIATLLMSTFLFACGGDIKSESEIVEKKSGEPTVKEEKNTVTSTEKIKTETLDASKVKEQSVMYSQYGDKYEKPLFVTPLSFDSESIILLINPVSEFDKIRKSKALTVNINGKKTEYSGYGDKGNLYKVSLKDWELLTTNADSSLYVYLEGDSFFEVKYFSKDEKSKEKTLTTKEAYEALIKTK